MNGTGSGSGCEGCGAPVAMKPGQTGQEAYNESFYGGFSVINLDNFYKYQESIGYFAQQLNFPEN